VPPAPAPQVQVVAPVAPVVVPPAPTARYLHTCAFPSWKSPLYVNNGCKAALDDAVLALKSDATSRLVLYCNGNPKRSNVRCSRIMGYLGAGIDPNRITSVPNGKWAATVDIWLVPAGASAPDPLPVVTP
jgi:hypothetical protein